jgi:hypothetical protein
VLSAAALAGVNVDYDPEWTDKFPLGYLPTLEDSDGFLLAECGAIAEYRVCRRVSEQRGDLTILIVSIGSDKSLLGRDLKESALNRQWESMSDTEVSLWR